VDVVAQADRDYSRESAAYKISNGLFGGLIIPRYYGSQICDASVDTASEVTKRPACLILIESVKGLSMFELDPAQLSEDQKSNIMVKAINAFDALCNYGVI
jgi:hypothetical protein